MSTLADELQNDFEDSGSEGEAENGGLFAGDDESSTGLVPLKLSNDEGEGEGMELDGDEEEVEDADGDAVMGDSAAEDINDTEATKARVEKMQLGAVEDVRSVAGLMRKLQPVLEVLIPPLFPTTKRCMGWTRRGRKS